MAEEHPWLEPIRAAAAAVAADQPPLTEWDAGAGGCYVLDDVEKILLDLSWPTRTRTFTAQRPVPGSSPCQTRPCECTETLFPVSWLTALNASVAEYVKARDADREPQPVPDRLRLRNLPQSADYASLRKLVEAAWDEAWDELACSVLVMWPDDRLCIDGLLCNLADSLWYGPYDPWADAGFQPAEGVCPLRTRRKGTYAERLSEEEADSFQDLRSLPSPKWRAWFLDTWTDRIAIHETLDACGVEVTDQLDVDLQQARYTFDADMTQVTIEELVTRLEARHRFLVSAFRTARDNAIGAQPSGEPRRPAFGQGRASTRPPNWDAMMEMVARLKGENVRWKEIKEQVETAYGYRFDSDEALRKHFDRWQKGRKPPG